MIYSNPFDAPFDDSLIRAVDVMVDRVASDHDENMYEHLSPLQYLHEYKTVFVKLPRRVGKTTYLKKLNYMSAQNSIVFVPKYQMIENAQYINAYTPSNYDVEIYATDRRRIDVILFDEVPASTAGKVVADLQHRIHKHTYIVGLGT